MAKQKRGRKRRRHKKQKYEDKPQGAKNTAPTKNALQSLSGMGQRLLGFMSDYSAHFLIRGKDVSQHASDYLSGLLGTYRRKNLECIHGDIPESNYQAMQQFVSDSPWSQDNLMTQVAGEVNGLLGGNRHSALLIAESSFV